MCVEGVDKMSCHEHRESGGQREAGARDEHELAWLMNECFTVQVGMLKVAAIDAKRLFGGRGITREASVRSIVLAVRTVWLQLEGGAGSTRAEKKAARGRASRTDTAHSHVRRP